MMTGDRVEAGARACFEHDRGDVGWRDALDDRELYLTDARIAIAAADECDRVAGVIRVDTADPGVAEQFAMILHHYDWRAADGDPTKLTRQLADECWAADEDLSHGEYRNRALFLLGALSVLAGAQPPPEGEQQ